MYNKSSYIIGMDLTPKEKFVREEIAKIYDQLVINCKKTCKAGYERWGYDLLPLCIEMFLTKDIDIQLKVIKDGKLENYITFMMSLQVKSSSSRFYAQYRKDSNSYREYFPNYEYKIEEQFSRPFADEEDEVITCIKNQMKKLNPYDKMLVDEILIQKEKYTTVSRKYNIPYASLKRDSQLLQIKIKQKCKHLL